MMLENLGIIISFLTRGAILTTIILSIFEEVEPLLGKDFIGSYLARGEDVSHNNRTIHLASMITLIGQAQRDARIRIWNQIQDGRIHTFIVQKSGTGKAPAFRYAKRIAEAAGFNFASETYMSTAGFLGTIEKGEPIGGHAAKYDIVGYEEASTIFYTAGQEHSKDLLNALNQALDVGGHVCKSLAHGTIEYNSHVSFIASTYPPVTKKTYIDSGFLPRLLLTYRPTGRDFYFGLYDWMEEGLGKPPNIGPDDEIRLAETLRRIMKMTGVGKDGTPFTYSFAVKGMLPKIKMDVMKEMNNYDDSVCERAEPFISRYCVYAIKLACAMAAIELKQTVEEKHWNNARLILDDFWKGTLEFISSYDVSISNPLMQRIRTAFRKRIAEGKHTMTVRELSRSMSGVTVSDIDEALITLKTQGVCEVFGLQSKHGGMPSRRIIILEP